MTASSRAIVYLVDDDDAVRDSTRLLLESENIAVADFSSPRGFLAAFDAASAACIVLDLHMPEISGAELLEMLRGRGVTTPVIVVSGRRDAALDAQIRRAGVTAIFSKPYDDNLLLEQIQALLATAS